jgi:hypothetical protein
MNDEQFDKLVASMTEMDQIVRGEVAPARVMEVPHPVMIHRCSR